jgi:hypothetical protein
VATFYRSVSPLYSILNIELTHSVADPGPESGALLIPESGMGKKSGSGSGMNNPDHISKSLKPFFCVTILKFFDADPGWKKFGSVIRDRKNSDPESGMEKIRIRNPVSGIKDKHPGSATLLTHYNTYSLSLAASTFSKFATIVQQPPRAPPAEPTAAERARQRDLFQPDTPSPESSVVSSWEDLHSGISAPPLNPLSPGKRFNLFSENVEKLGPPHKHNQIL